MDNKQEITLEDQKNIFTALDNFVKIQEPRTKLLDELKILITNPIIKENPFIAIFLNQVLPSQSYGALVERVLINTLDNFDKSAVKQYDAVGPNGERHEVKYSQSTEKNKTQFNIAQLRENATDNYLFLCMNFSDMNEQVLSYKHNKSSNYKKRWLEKFKKTLSDNMYLIFTTPVLLNRSLNDVGVKPTISGSNADGVTTSTQSKRFTVDDIKMREIQDKLREYTIQSVGDYGKNPATNLETAAEFYLTNRESNVKTPELIEFQKLSSQFEVIDLLNKTKEIKTDEHYSWSHMIDMTLDCWVESYQSFKIVDKNNPNFGQYPNINKEVLFQLLIEDKDEVQYGNFTINKDFLIQNNAKGEQNTDYEVTRLRRILINAVLDNSPHAKTLYSFKKQIDSIHSYNILKDKLISSCDTMLSIMNHPEFSTVKNIIEEKIIDETIESQRQKDAEIAELKHQISVMLNQNKRLSKENSNLTDIINSQTEQILELEHNASQQIQLTQKESTPEIEVPETKPQGFGYF